MTVSDCLTSSVVSALAALRRPRALSAACAKVLRRSPADVGASGDVGHVLRAGRAAGHQRGKAWVMANARHLGSSRGPGAISVAREDRSENAAQRVDSSQTDSMIVRQSDHPVKDYFFDGDPFSEDGATGRIGE